jgi:hypothetical protein
MTKGQFIAMSIVLCGTVGIYVDGSDGSYIYYTGLDVIWYREGTWFVNGEYGPDPRKLI